MAKLPFLTNERASRLMVCLLFGAGVLLPLLLAFGLGGSIAAALAVFAVVTALPIVLGGSRKGRIILACVAGAAALVQLFLPNLGFFGASVEAFKAISLYFNSIPAAAPLFATQIALLLAVAVGVMTYAFTSKEVGFMPAAVLLVLVLFGIWSLGKPELLWYALPALVALLLLISQASHEKINLFEVLPMAAIVVLLSMLLLPRGQTVIPPLYDSAMDLKQTISDYLFFTEPRNVFTLGSYGYYPMGSGKLGGEATPSEYPVMLVKTDRRTLMRAVVKDEYTGRSWRDTSSGKRYLYVNPRWAKLRETVFLENMPSDAVRAASALLDEKAIAVQVENTAASTVFTPLFLRSFSAQNDMVAYFNDASELFITRDLKLEDRYTVIAPVFEGGDAGLGALVEAAPKGSDPNYASTRNEYTSLPDHLEKKVYDDLNNIIASAATPYDQACAIMRHLQRYYKYSLSPKTPPENQDFVTYFMYVGKEGYCTYYASAMTVLCRMAGLPARYVEGFVAQPGGDGLAYVTGKDAHAWTEVYFEGFGWVPFDATPSQENVDNQQSQNEPDPTPTPEPTPEPSPEPNDEPSPPPDEPTPSDDPNPDDSDPQTDETPPDNPFAWWWLLLALATAALIALLLTRRMPDRIAAKQTSERDKLYVYGNATYQLIRLGKRTPAAGETPLAFARRMDRQKAFPVPILPLWRMMALSNYSRMKPGAQQTARAKETFLRMFKTQRGLAKLRFRLRAALNKRFYTVLDTRLEHVEPTKAYAYRFKTKGAAKAQGGKAKRGQDAPQARPVADKARDVSTPPSEATTPNRSERPASEPATRDEQPKPAAPATAERPKRRVSKEPKESK